MQHNNRLEVYVNPKQEYLFILVCVCAWRYYHHGHVAEGHRLIGLQMFQHIDTSILYFKWRHFNA